MGGYGGRGMDLGYGGLGALAQQKRMGRNQDPYDMGGMGEGEIGIGDFMRQQSATMDMPQQYGGNIQALTAAMSPQAAQPLGGRLDPEQMRLMA